jgi:hypothetical protein
MTSKKYLLSIAIAVTLVLSPISVLQAKEGMWIPMLLRLLNGDDMQGMGLRISADDIYSVNHSSLKDAIVIFGGGCTGVIVSDEGLVLTNHHCGYGSIQRHSSVERDYLTEGFWASTHEQELPNPGLSCTLLIRMENVTGQALAGVTATMTEVERQVVIAGNIERITGEAVQDTPYRAEVKPFYYGNEYYLLVYEVFRDVRLVGTPPASIGNFGGDTDNWIWPRHTGDFSVFRIYAGQDNQPTEYSADNVPYKPKNHIKISLQGCKPGDFTFVFGFPGFTQEYLPSYGIQMIALTENPLRIDLRTKALNIILHGMEQSETVRLQYASKHVGIANAWKKWMGETRGIQLFHVVDKKRDFESRFQQWADEDPGRKATYGTLLPAFHEVYRKLTPFRLAQDYYSEAAMRIEAVRFAYGFRNLVRFCKTDNPDQTLIAGEVDRLKHASESFFKNYNATIDKDLFITMLTAYINGCSDGPPPEVLKMIQSRYKGDIHRYAEEVYKRSMFVTSDKCLSFLAGFRSSDARKIRKDPAYHLAEELGHYYQSTVLPQTNKGYVTLDSLMRIYMKGQMEMETGRSFYPDANGTMRVTYGQIKGYDPRDAVQYNFFTTLKGVMEKEDTTVYDYAVNNRLKELFSDHDYGRYADKDGTMHVCFTASNHTTGGNSGSPVFNADGYLIGLNFDRNWEGTMSDLMYDPDHCRNISLDIRYCLFIIDKVAEAEYLIDEMDIAE